VNETISPIIPAMRASGERGSLTQEVYERLKEEIFAFRMPPGRRYSEHELAASLQLSRTPLRLALHVLAHDGFIQNVGGHSCWQVRPFDLAYYEDLYDFRVEIEAIALRRLCARAQTPDLSALAQIWSVAASRRSQDGALVAKQDEQFHRTLVELADNAEMLRAYDRLTDRIRIVRRLDFISPARIVATYVEHDAILRAIDRRQGAKVERLIRGHIATSREEIRRITFHQMAMAMAPQAAAAAL
jgi:DNA-binding GntR family transcriptional regulator